jgi:3-hydroxy-9,10-secoandrosta-1,3,5(10)-triene-9,17-dione monooxygenase
VAEDPSTQMVAARAASLIDEVRLVLRRNMTTLMEQARTGADMPLEQRVRFRYDSSNVVAKCVEAVDGLFTASGGRAIFLNSPLLRFFMDVHAARAHYANNPEKPGRNLGGVLLDLKNADFFL